MKLSELVFEIGEPFCSVFRVLTASITLVYLMAYFSPINLPCKACEHFVVAWARLQLSIALVFTVKQLIPQFVFIFMG